jgi:hypothetical protein
MAATNTLPNRASGGGLYSHAAAISLSDSSDLDYVTQAILASAACTVKVTTVGGESVALPLAAGYNPIRVTKVFSTGTTLSGATLWALW